MANAIVQPALGGDLDRSARMRRFAPPRHLGLVPWAVAPVLVMAAVVHYQAHLRAPLTWDEASRVDGGAVLDLALSAASPQRVWDWFSALDLPFVAPTLHGLALVLVQDPAVAAWLPSTIAFAAAGVLSALLARRLGAGTAGSWAAAALAWTTPIGAKLAAGAFTENLGACLLVGLVLVLDRLHRQPSNGVAVAAGSLVALAWWTSHDYGITAAALVAASAVVASRRWSRQTRLHLLAGAGAAALVAAHALATGSTGRTADSLWRLLGDDRSLRGTDLMYYPRALFENDSFARTELGLSPVVAAALVFGALWALGAWRRRPEWRLPVLAVGMWVAVYASAGVKGARFVAVILPVLAALAAAGGRELLASRLRRPALAAGAATLALAVLAAADPALVVRVLPLVALVALAVLRVPVGNGRSVARAAAAATAVVTGFMVVPAQITDQASSLRDQLWFVERNEPADRALAFIGDHLPMTGSRPILMIGAASALSPQLVQLAWDHRLGERSAGVHLVPEAGARDRSRRLAETVAALRPVLIVAVRTGSTSKLAPDRTANGNERFPSQRDYARRAVELARDGELLTVGSLTLEDDPLRIDIWQMAPATDQGDDDR